MKRMSTEREVESSPTWDELEAFARQGVQRLLQRVLEEEVDGVLGRRGRYERRAAVDAGGGYRDGYGNPRRLSVMAGKDPEGRMRPAVDCGSDGFSIRGGGAPCRTIGTLDAQMTSSRSNCWPTAGCPLR